MRFSRMTIFAALALASGPALADETGDWLVADGNAQIHIENCSGALWGFVAWEKEPGGRDAQNPDPAKRDRPTLGLPILLNMQPAQNNPGRFDGEVYNAENGKTYTAHIALTDADTLRIEGCVLGFLCGGQSWTRAKPPEAPAAPAAAAASRMAAGKPAATAAPKAAAAGPKVAALTHPIAGKPPAAAKPGAANAPRGATGAVRTASAAVKPEPEKSFCSTLGQ